MDDSVENNGDIGFGNNDDRYETLKENFLLLKEKIFNSARLIDEYNKLREDSQAAEEHYKNLIACERNATKAIRLKLNEREFNFKDLSKRNNQLMKRCDEQEINIAANAKLMEQQTARIKELEEEQSVKSLEFNVVKSDLEIQIQDLKKELAAYHKKDPNYDKKLARKQKKTSPFQTTRQTGLIDFLLLNNDVPEVEAENVSSNKNDSANDNSILSPVLKDESTSTDDLPVVSTPSPKKRAPKKITHSVEVQVRPLLDHKGTMTDPNTSHNNLYPLHCNKCHATLGAEPVDEILNAMTTSVTFIGTSLPRLDPIDPPNNSVGISAVSSAPNSQLVQNVQGRVDVRQDGGAGTQNGDKDYEELKKEVLNIKKLIKGSKKSNCCSQPKNCCGSSNNSSNNNLSVDLLTSVLSQLVVKNVNPKKKKKRVKAKGKFIRRKVKVSKSFGNWEIKEQSRSPSRSTSRSRSLSRKSRSSSRSRTSSRKSKNSSLSRKSRSSSRRSKSSSRSPRRSRSLSRKSRISSRSRSSSRRSRSLSRTSSRRSTSRSKVSRSPSLTRSRKRSRVESSSGSKDNLDSRSCSTSKSRRSKVSRSPSKESRSQQNDKKFNRIKTCPRISTSDPENENLESRPDSNGVKNLSTTDLSESEACSPKFTNPVSAIKNRVKTVRSNSPELLSEKVKSIKTNLFSTNKTPNTSTKVAKKNKRSGEVSKTSAQIQSGILKKLRKLKTNKPLVTTPSSSILNSMETGESSVPESQRKRIAHTPKTNLEVSPVGKRPATEAKVQPAKRRRVTRSTTDKDTSPINPMDLLKSLVDPESSSDMPESTQVQKTPETSLETLALEEKEKVTDPKTPGIEISKPIPTKRSPKIVIVNGIPVVKKPVGRPPKNPDGVKRKYTRKVKAVTSAEIVEKPDLQNRKLESLGNNSVEENSVGNILETSESKTNSPMESLPIIESSIESQDEKVVEVKESSGESRLQNSNRSGEHENLLESSKSSSMSSGLLEIFTESEPEENVPESSQVNAEKSNEKVIESLKINSKESAFTKKSDVVTTVPEFIDKLQKIQSEQTLIENSKTVASNPEVLESSEPATNKSELLENSKTAQSEKNLLANSEAVTNDPKVLKSSTKVMRDPEAIENSNSVTSDLALLENTKTVQIEQKLVVISETTTDELKPLESLKTVSSDSVLLESTNTVQDENKVIGNLEPVTNDPKPIKSLKSVTSDLELLEDTKTVTSDLKVLENKTADSNSPEVLENLKTVTTNDLEPNATNTSIVSKPENPKMNETSDSRVKNLLEVQRVSEKLELNQEIIIGDGLKNSEVCIQNSSTSAESMETEEFTSICSETSESLELSLGLDVSDAFESIPTSDDDLMNSETSDITDKKLEIVEQSSEASGIGTVSELDTDPELELLPKDSQLDSEPDKPLEDKISKSVIVAESLEIKSPEPESKDPTLATPSPAPVLEKNLESSRPNVPSRMLPKMIEKPTKAFKLPLVQKSKLLETSIIKKASNSRSTPEAVVTLPASPVDESAKSMSLEATRSSPENTRSLRNRTVSISPPKTLKSPRCSPVAVKSTSESLPQSPKTSKPEPNIPEAEPELSPKSPDALETLPPRQSSIQNLLDFYLHSRISSNKTYTQRLTEEIAVTKSKSIEKFIKSEYQRLLDAPNWTNDLNDSFIANLEKLDFNEMNFANVTVELMKERCELNEPLNREYTPPAPLMTVSQQKIIGFLARYEQRRPGIMFKVMDIIDSTLFRLKNNSDNETDTNVLEGLARFFVLMAKIKKDRERVRIMICDALYCFQTKAFNILYVVLTCWAEVIPTYDENTMSLPPQSRTKYLVISIATIIRNQKRFKEDHSKITCVKNLLSHLYQYPDNFVTNKIIVDLLEAFKFEEYDRCLVPAIALIAKREGVDWTYKNIVKKLLLMIVNKNESYKIYETFKLLGYLLRPFPVDDEGKEVEKIVNQLCEILDAGTVEPEIQEGIALTLLTLTRHYFISISTTLLRWQPPRPLNNQLQQLLQTFFQSRTPEYWKQIANKRNPRFPAIKYKYNPSPLSK
ncbi:serine/arginine repetitive matrix protein 2-like [Microplitis mediator]|uniref:serine/arginine repetitive matrix protein 2-like n=1 Tax=Microplitis mediator TaxID=375433 RepID=UPI0025532258|nr:serine/arginine repetitive matrix protein 2-like [Microplitis mediator]